MSEVIFRVAHQGGKIFRYDLFVQIHLDIIHTFLDLHTEVGVRPVFVDTPDEIIVHHHCKRVQLIQRFCRFCRLNVAVPQGVRLLRGKTALNGGTAHQRGEHDDGSLTLAQNIAALHRHACAHAHTVGKRLLVIQVSGANHLQHSLLRHPDLMPVMGNRIAFQPFVLCCTAVHIAQLQPLPGQAVVHHQQIAVHNGVLQGRNFFKGFVKLDRPCHTDLQLAVIFQPFLDPAHCHIPMEHRPDDPDTLQFSLFLFKGCAPQKTQCRPQGNGHIVPVPMLQHPLFATEQFKCTGKKCLVRAVAPQELPLCIIAPCIYISAALDKLGKQHHILENIHV